MTGDPISPELPPRDRLNGPQGASTPAGGALDVRVAQNGSQGPSEASSVTELREHVTAIHLMGLQLDKMRDQLDEIENWFWHQLADAREQQSTPADPTPKDRP